MALPGVVIIGIGNPVRGDDGAGIAVAHRLKEQFTAEVNVVEEAGDGLFLSLFNSRLQSDAGDRSGADP